MPDRIIRESICASETLNQLTDFEERFWHRLIVNCDDHGRFDARPAILRGRLFPLMQSRTNQNMTDALQALASAGLIDLYEVDGRPFLQVVTWEKYQRIRAKRSKFPPPADIGGHLPSSAVKCPRNPIQSESNPKRNAEADARAGSPVPGEAVAYFLDRVNPTASADAVKQLTAFADELSDAVCIKAINIAIDEKKTGWAYIRAILRRYAEAGVRCLADADKLDAERDAGRSESHAGKAGSPGGSGRTAGIRLDAVDLGGV